MTDEDIRETVSSHSAWINGHEALCAERFSSIKSSIKLLIQVIAWSGGVLILTMIAAIGYFMNLEFGQISVPIHGTDYAVHAHPMDQK